jgi:hypothetical protein
LDNGYVGIYSIPDGVTISVDGEEVEIKEGRALIPWFPKVSI